MKTSRIRWHKIFNIIKFASFLLIILMFFHWLKTKEEKVKFSNNLILNKNPPKKTKANKTYCTFQNLEELSEYGRQNQYSNRIPKIVHYFYKSAILPNEIIEFMRNCISINSKVKFVFWTEFSAYMFFIKEFGKKLPIPTEDVKYFILSKIGGISMDPNTKCVKPFSTIMTESSCVLHRENDIMSGILYDVEYMASNNFMACLPSHQFLQYMINRIWSLVTDPLKPDPLMLTYSFINFTSDHTLIDSNNRLKSVQLNDLKILSFYPVEHLENYCNRKLVGKWKKTSCSKLSEIFSYRKQKMKEIAIIQYPIQSKIKTVNYRSKLCYSGYKIYLPFL